MTRAYSIVVVHGISGPKTWVRFPVCSFFNKTISPKLYTLAVSPQSRSVPCFRNLFGAALERRGNLLNWIKLLVHL